MRGSIKLSYYLIFMFISTSSMSLFVWCYYTYIRIHWLIIRLLTISQQYEHQLCPFSSFPLLFLFSWIIYLNILWPPVFYSLLFTSLPSFSCLPLNYVFLLVTFTPLYLHVSLHYSGLHDHEKEMYITS